MKLTAEEEALRAGECGEAAQWAIEHQIKVGCYLGARDFVPVTQAHIMADTESLAPTGVEWLERLARLPAQARRSPRYGYHLEERRRATLVVNVGFTPRELNQWRALGGAEGFEVEEIAARKAMTMRDRPLQRRSRRSDS